jgi:DNA-binding transcriptional ArsR family regulator
MARTGHEWIDAFAARLGAEAPSAAEREAILDFAGEAAHSSERIAAPIACWIAAKHGVSIADAMRAAQELG